MTAAAGVGVAGACDAMAKGGQCLLAHSHPPLGSRQIAQQLDP